MDSSTVGHSFPPHAPIRYAFTIVHLLSMSIAYLGFYPHALTQLTTSSPHKKQRLLISLGCAAFFTVVGLVAGWHVPTTTTTTITTASSSTILHLTGLNLILLVLTILDYTLERIGVGSSLHHQQHSQEEQPSTLSWLYSWVYHVPNKVHMVLKGITLCLGYFYLASSVLVLTLTCQSLDQCWLPLSMGLGFLLFGSLSFMHLVNIVTLPRHASPEYVEALWILFCGCLSMIWWNAPLLGSSWKAINLGLLWTTGSILSLAVTFQTWFPFLQKRNIVNSLIFCLTGKGILSGYSDDSLYSMEVQLTLGYALVIGSMARFTQIMFRKSTIDNLPRLYSRASGTGGGLCDDDQDGDDATCVEGLDIIRQRASDYESTYRQLIGMNSLSSSADPSRLCKHQSVYASITLVCGLLYCFSSIVTGFFFIGAIVEWVDVMRYYIVDPATYINVLLSISFLWTSYLLILASLCKTGSKSVPDYDFLDLAAGEYCGLPIYSRSSTPPLATYYNVSNKGSSNSNSYNNNALMKTSLTAPPYDSTHQLAKTKHHQSAPLSATTCNGSSSSSSSSTSSSSTPSSPKPMRPSQYRAKRRSLLIATSAQTTTNQDTNRAQRTLSASSFTGVGGVLPDEVSIHGDYYSVSPATVVDPSSTTNDIPHSSPTLQRRSWRSGSSSPPLRPTPSTDTSNAPSHPWRQPDDDGDNRRLHKTESGRRKDRHWKKSKRRRDGATLSDDDEHVSLPYSGSDGLGRLHSYSSDRNSVNSHLFK